MTVEELAVIFEAHADKYLTAGEGVARRDLAAFNRLHELVPGKGDIVACAEHDEFWLSIKPEDVAAVASEEDILFLIRCGIRFDEDTDSFAMFA